MEHSKFSHVQHNSSFQRTPSGTTEFKRLGAYSMPLRAYFIVLLSVSALVACSPDPVKLSAPPGQYQTTDLGARSEATQISVKISLTTFNNDTRWPPAAYVGFYEGPNRDKSIQLMLVHNNPADNYIVVGYRIIEEGKQTQIVSLENVPLDKPVDVSMSFSKGTVTLRVNQAQPIDVPTHLSVVTPYASVSSGMAEFEQRT